MTYAKPMLALSGDSLRVMNLPVPKRGYGLSAWWTRNAEPIGALRISQFLQRLVARLNGTGINACATDVAESTRLQQTQDVVKRVLLELQQSHAARGSRLILVLLPTSYELRGRAQDEWSRFLTEEAATLGVPFLDLFPKFRTVPEADRAALFLSANAVNYPAAAGHYTRAGNALVASEIHALLRRTGALPAADSSHSR